MKKELLRFIASLVIRSSLLPILLSIADRWSIKRKTNLRLTFPFVKRRKHFGYQILVYHRVNDKRDPFFNGVPVRVFAKQMEMLCRYFNVLPMEELVERARKDDVPPNAIAITFDDGYLDNFENAFPILKQFCLPATIFLVTGVLDSQSHIWHDRVFDAFRRTNAGAIAIEGKEYSLRNLTEKRTVLDTLLRTLRMCNPRDRDELIQQLVTRLGVPEQRCVNGKKLSWKEIEEMSKDKITFGAHTVTHPILTRMPLAEAVVEIMTSKEAIEKAQRFPVRLFAYPNGGRNDFNESIKQVLREAGFLCAVTSLWGNNDVHTDPFELQRLGIWDLDPRMSALKLGWYKFFS